MVRFVSIKPLNTELPPINLHQNEYENEGKVDENMYKSAPVSVNESSRGPDKYLSWKNFFSLSDAFSSQIWQLLLCTFIESEYETSL